MRLMLAGLSFAAVGCAAWVPPAQEPEPESEPEELGSAPEPAESSSSAASSAGVEIIGHEPEHAWVRPSFDTAEGRLEAGTAFVCVVDPGEPALLLTAQHLFGPAGGLERDYHWSEMRAKVEGARGVDATGQLVLWAGPPLTIEGAEALGPDGVGKDLAAFPLNAPTRIHAMPLAPTMPAVGAQVWLLAPVLGDDSLRHGATVREFGDDYFEYEFDASIELRATSGAAIINEAGEVVAINLGGGREGGQVVGIGVPATAIRELIHAARAAER